MRQEPELSTLGSNHIMVLGLSIEVALILIKEDKD